MIFIVINSISSQIARNVSFGVFIFKFNAAFTISTKTFFNQSIENTALKKLVRFEFVFNLS